MSLPSRERELKPESPTERQRFRAVAPFTGARVETTNGNSLRLQAVTSLPSRERELKHLLHRGKRYFVRSLPSRERELKLLFIMSVYLLITSLPSRERELKLLLVVMTIIFGLVAPFTGARVETLLTDVFKT